MDPHNSYYFLINRLGPTGNQQARGPIPVLNQAIPGLGGFGNGFATGSANAGNVTNGQTDYGLTDYVVYSNNVRNGIQLYHINDDPNNTASATANPQGAPTPYALPDYTNTQNISQATTLTFTLHVSQLLTSAETAGQTQAQIVALANQIRWLQVNIVATNYVPVNQASAPEKQVDAMGNSTLAADLSSWLTIDLSQNRIYDSNGPYQTISTPEPQGDIYPPGTANDQIDLQYWSIKVSQQ